MTDHDRENDKRALTPILIMAVLLVCGFLFYAWTGHAPPTQG